MTAILLSAAASLFAVLARPRCIMENTFLRELLCVSPFWLASRVLGAVLTVFLLPPFAWYSCM